MPRYDEQDERYRASHPAVRREREGAQRERNVRDAATTLDKGTREQVRDLVRDPFADRE